MRNDKYKFNPLSDDSSLFLFRQFDLCALALCAHCSIQTIDFKCEYFEVTQLHRTQMCPLTCYVYSLKQYCQIHIFRWKLMQTTINCSHQTAMMTIFGTTASVCNIPTILPHNTEKTLECNGIATLQHFTMDRQQSTANELSSYVVK